MAILDSVGTGITTVLGWTKTVIAAFFTTEGALAELAPMIGIGVAISAIMLGYKFIKATVWGS